MWIDERGSEVLELAECRRLLALGAKRGLHGHLGIEDDGAPLIIPVNYSSTEQHDVVIVVGDGLLAEIESHSKVAFQVDGDDEGRLWSVLLRGVAQKEDASQFAEHLPVPVVADPGINVVRIRSDVLTGRKLLPTA